MKYSNLIALRELRIQEKAIKAHIDEIIDAATDEAVAVLAAQGLDRGEFTIENDLKFQLQRTDVFHLEDHHKYQSEEAVEWRKKNKERTNYQSKAKACTASMAGLLKTFLELNPDKQPDEIKLVLKVVESDKRESNKEKIA
jgi:hypothetical protein